MGTLGSRPLVTARVMRAARFSWSSSISRSFFATSPSILAVSWSRRPRCCACSPSGGRTTNQVLHDPHGDVYLQARLPPLRAISICQRAKREFIVKAKKRRSPRSAFTWSLKSLSHSRSRGRHVDTSATEPTSSREPLALDMRRSPAEISSSGTGGLAGRALCSDSTNCPRFTHRPSALPIPSSLASRCSQSGLHPCSIRRTTCPNALHRPSAPESAPATRRRSPCTPDTA